MKSISVVIPNYNGKELLKKNIPTVLAALEYNRSDYEVIVADDCSVDDSVPFLKEKFTQVQVVVGDQNLGFSGNINRGLRVARKDLVLALNSDVSLEKDYFTYQLPYFENPHIFGVMGALLFPESKQVQRLDLYPKQDFWGYFKSMQIPGYQFDKPTRIFFVSVSNVLMDRNKLNELNGFNELFSPFYGEDLDLGFRAWRMGWESLYEPRSKAYHQASTTISQFNKKKKIRLISRRNKIIFHDLHLQGWQRCLFFLKMSLDVLSRWIILDTSYYKALVKYLMMRKSISDFKKRSFFRFDSQETLQTIQQRIHNEPF